MALQLQILTTFLDPCPHMLVWQNPRLAEVRQFFLQIKVLNIVYHIFRFKKIDIMYLNF